MNLSFIFLVKQLAEIHAYGLAHDIVIIVLDSCANTSTLMVHESICRE